MLLFEVLHVAGLACLTCFYFEDLLAHFTGFMLFVYLLFMLFWKEFQSFLLLLQMLPCEVMFLFEVLLVAINYVL